MNLLFFANFLTDPNVGASADGRQIRPQSRRLDIGESSAGFSAFRLRRKPCDARRSATNGVITRLAETVREAIRAMLQSRTSLRTASFFFEMFPGAATHRVGPVGAGRPRDANPTTPAKTRRSATSLTTGTPLAPTAPVGRRRVRVARRVARRSAD